MSLFSQSMNSIDMKYINTQYKQYLWKRKCRKCNSRRKNFHFKYFSQYCKLLEEVKNWRKGGIFARKIYLKIRIKTIKWYKIFDIKWSFAYTHSTKSMLKATNHFRGFDVLSSLSTLYVMSLDLESQPILLAETSNIHIKYIRPTKS